MKILWGLEPPETYSIKTMVNMNKIDKILRENKEKCLFCNRFLFANSLRYLTKKFITKRYMECPKCHKEFIILTYFTENYESFIKNEIQSI